MRSIGLSRAKFWLYVQHHQRSMSYSASLARSSQRTVERSLTRPYSPANWESPQSSASQERYQSPTAQPSPLTHKQAASASSNEPNVPNGLLV